MILLTTDEARVVHAFLTFGEPVVALMSDRDKGHLDGAKAKLQKHSDALLQSLRAVQASGGKAG